MRRMRSTIQLLAVLVVVLSPSQVAAKLPTNINITNVGALADSTVAGQPVLVQYTVSFEGTATLSGTVDLYVNGSAVVAAPATAGQCTFTRFAAGNISIQARYSGNTSLEPSASAPVTHHVARAATTTVFANAAQLASTPTVAWNLFNMIATVTPVAPGSGTPYGGVSFYMDGSQLCPGTLGPPGCSYIASWIGEIELQARFFGDANFLPSESPVLVHELVPRPSSIAISNATQLATPTPAGEPFVVSWSTEDFWGVPLEGTVTILADDEPVCTVTLGTRHCTVTPTRTGNISLRADYSGGPTVLPSTSAPVTHVVGATTDAGSSSGSPLSLLEAWPSPARSTAFIAVALDAPGQVSAALFDLGGRRVRTILAGELLPAGRSVRSWQAQGIAPGVYVMEAHAPGRAQRRKVVVLRSK